MINIKHIPKEVEEMIQAHINMIESTLPDFLEAYYLCGSVSLGAFDYGKSDIDFIIMMKRHANERDIHILKNIHRDLHRKYKTILDGMYLYKEDIEFLVNRDIPSLRFNDGYFKGVETFNRNTVDAFVLKKWGITVKGEEIAQLKYTVDFSILMSNMRDNLNTYWVNWVSACKKFPSTKYLALVVSPKAIEWGVLGVSRIYYSLREKDITSKVGAGEYALQTVPQKWHKIIEESMRLRKDNKKSFYNSIFERRRDALAYMDYIIQESNKLIEMKE